MNITNSSILSLLRVAKEAFEIYVYIASFEKLYTFDISYLNKENQ